MKDWPKEWLRDALWYALDALGSTWWVFRCLWWAGLTWAQYIWLIKIRHEVE